MVVVAKLGQGLPLTFQYSLCRVVLMVYMYGEENGIFVDFQYSLCRVVLMVPHTLLLEFAQSLLSVLALSSRFDGRNGNFNTAIILGSFSTRSVESF